MNALHARFKFFKPVIAGKKARKLSVIQPKFSTVSSSVTNKNLARNINAKGSVAQQRKGRIPTTSICACRHVIRHFLVEFICAIYSAIAMSVSLVRSIQTFP